MRRDRPRPRTATRAAARSRPTGRGERPLFASLPGDRSCGDRGHLVQEARGVAPGAERLATQDPDRELAGRGDARDLEFRQCAHRARDRRRPVLVPDDDLADERVVVRGDDGARLDMRVHPHARAERRTEMLDPAGSGREVPRDVLGVDPRLDRVAATLDPARPFEALPGGHLELLTDEVDARHELRYRMLDLQARVQLHEVEAAVGAEEKLERTRVAIAELEAGTLDGAFDLLAERR